MFADQHQVLKKSQSYDVATQPICIIAHRITVTGHHRTNRIQMVGQEVTVRLFLV